MISGFQTIISGLILEDKATYYMEGRFKGVDLKRFEVWEQRD